MVYFISPGCQQELAKVTTGLVEEEWGRGGAWSLAAEGEKGPG